MTANASSSSLQSRSESPLTRVDLAAAGLLAPLPAAWLGGRDTDLLEPLRFLPPGKLPLGFPPPAPDRRELAEALAVANRGYGNENADRLARKLADPATRVVVTGQQPGLFGGPLYCLAKMIAAVRWAAALEEAGEPAVAVFWVATEDHDWAEAASAVVLAPEGPRVFDLGPDPEPLTPLGMRTLGPGIDDVLRGMAEAVPGEALRRVDADPRPLVPAGRPLRRGLLPPDGPHPGSPLSAAPRRHAAGPQGGPAPLAAQAGRAAGRSWRRRWPPATPRSRPGAIRSR